MLSMLHGGNALTTTVAEQELVQPLAFVTVTGYVVFDAGLPVIEAVVAALLHKNEVPPDAVSVAESPGQSESETAMLHTGAGFTVTVDEHVLVHPLALVTVTVYVVVVVGLTVIEAVVAALLQRNDVPPDAVNVEEPPTQIEGLFGVMLQVGAGFTVTVAEHELVHPLALVTVTVYVVVVVGLTVIEAVVAALLQRNDVPPDAVNVEEPPTQIEGLFGVMLQVGAGFTVTVDEHVLVHPLALVTVTVYVVVVVGLTVIEAVVAALLQRNDVPPDAVNVEEPPTQIEGLFGVMLQVGAGFTVTVAEHELVHPLALVTVTVYVVVVVGLTVIEAVVAALLQRNDVPPDAVNVDEPPTHIEGLFGVMLQVGAGFTVTVAEHELVHPLALVTVTVYVVVVAGLTVIEAVVAALLQRNEVPPDAVNVEEPPTQIEGLFAVMLQVGPGFTVTVVEQELVHPFASVTVTV